MFGGMPGYIRNMKRPPVVDEQPLPPIPSLAGQAPPKLNADFDSLMTQLGGQAPAQPPRMANAAPQGLMAQGKPAHQSGPSKGLLGSETFQKPDMTLSDKMGLISGMLMDYDGTMGSGNADRARGMYDQRVGEAQGTFEEQRQRKLMEAAAGGDMNAMFMLDPSMALGERRDRRDFRYGVGRDQTLDERFERGYTDERGDRAEDVDFRERGFQADEAARRAQASAASSAGRFGVTPVFGRDANGNRVLLQTNTAGGVDMASLPEGVTLEDDYSRSFNRTLGTEDAKKAAYESQAGQALTAFETRAEELMGQIDTAIDQTSGLNTGVIGQFIAAGDLDGTLDAIGAKAMLSELIAIKNQGGALGALSDSEGKALRDAAVNVARSQSEKQLDANLKAYRLQVETSRMRLKQAFEEQYVNNSGGARPAGGGGGQGRPVGPSGQPVPEGFE
jgi:hypothetical protein